LLLLSWSFRQTSDKQKRKELVTVTIHEKMSSIELKPKICLHSCKTKADVDEINWSEPRDKVPMILQAQGVRLSTWKTTFDSLEALYFSQVEGEKKKPSFNPYVVYKRLCRKKQENGLDRGLLEHLVQEQRQIYSSYGIRVSIAAKTIASFSRGCDQTKLVGLCFTSASASAPFMEERAPSMDTKKPVHLRQPSQARQPEMIPVYHSLVF
jgi:hypothetical protein